MIPAENENEFGICYQIWLDFIVCTIKLLITFITCKTSLVPGVQKPI